MNKEEMRLALNKFLKLYYNACNEVYKEINFNQIKGIRFKYLKEIYKNEKMTITELAQTFSISKPTVTEVIKHFENNGIVKKIQCTNDKRINYIHLTELGELLASTNKLESQRAVEKLEEAYTAEELGELVTLFNKLGGKEL